MVAVAESGMIERLRQGDAQALEALMTRYSGRVFRLTFGITRTRLRQFLLDRLGRPPA